MPAEDTITITMTHDARGDIERLAARAQAAGCAFPPSVTTRREGRRWVRSLGVQVSPIVHAALAFASSRMPFATPPPPTTDGERIKAAMARAGVNARWLGVELECARSTIDAAISGKTPLPLAAGGKLLPWVEAIEATMPIAKSAPLPTNADGARLKAAMAKANISARKLARDLGGYHHSLISQVCKGSLALEVAMGGALLAWVEKTERTITPTKEPT